MATDGLVGTYHVGGISGTHAFRLSCLERASNFDLLTIVAGIHPLSAGFESLSIEPNLGTLHRAEVTMPTPKGMVEVEYRRQTNGVEAHIVLPEGTSGRLLWKGRAQSLRSGPQTLTLQ